MQNKKSILSNNKNAQLLVCVKTNEQLFVSNDHGTWTKVVHVKQMIAMISICGGSIVHFAEKV